MSLELFERPGGGERAILVGVDFGQDHKRSLSEFEELAVSAGAQLILIIEASRKSPDARYYVGSGKAEEIANSVAAEEADLVMFNHQLSASQERNLEKLFKCRVLDRTGLILDIFAQRARSFEGKLQVELAQLNHLSTRLVRGWTHLERQKGGIGLRGPGETQLETDRRLLGQRIALLQKRLKKVGSQREQSRRSRVRSEISTVSLVGYTNAGKSTLFNRLTGADVYAEDQLFATLDATVRKLELPGAGRLVLADTVGFVSNLPHDLVAAFRSTLLETREADLLLHLVDASDEDSQYRIEQVNNVLAEIGAERVPQILVYNKIDLTEREPELLSEKEDHIPRVAVSAKTGDGIEVLAETIVEFFNRHYAHGWINLSPQEGRFRSSFFELGDVLVEEYLADGTCRLQVRIALNQLQKLGIDPARLIQADEHVLPTTVAMV